MINRFSSLKLNTHMTVRNRIVIPPMASETAHPDGTASERTLEHYKRLSQAKAGIIFVEYTFIHPSGRSEENQLGLTSEKHMQALLPVVDLLRKSGAKAGIQLTHAGGKSETRFTGGALMAPAPIAPPVKDKKLETPVPMTRQDIQNWIHWFVEAAERAAKIGFEIIELHAAHGYGLNQWLSPSTNRRSGGYGNYGGELQGRLRILLEVIRGIRLRLPHITLAIRMPGRDFLPEGLSTEEAAYIAKALGNAGCDLIDISSGLGGWRRPLERVGEGYLVSEAANIQKQIQKPVIGVGGIQTGAFIDQALEKNYFSLAAVGRAILKDPAGWWEENMKFASPEMEELLLAGIA